MVELLSSIVIVTWALLIAVATVFAIGAHEMYNDRKNWLITVIYFPSLVAISFVAGWVLNLIERNYYGVS